MVALRLDHRLAGRVDPSDVLQEVLLEATQRRADYERQPDPMPLFLWLRFLAAQRIQILHRRHLGTRARDAARELSIDHAPMPEATSAALAAQLLGRDTRASEALHRAERRLRLQAALEQLDPIDREVLALRHFEHLSNVECARVLGLQESAATKRYIRALRRLKEVLAGLPGGLSELIP
jgi:RNA polymerase sigma-70 factor (ECF subfamily)